VESECQRLVTVWFTEGKEERDIEADFSIEKKKLIPFIPAYLILI
jgi:hypothetical protein